ncbi:MAG: nicotinate-nucleotide adenylyltransferase [Deltaproteobacteria bacterium]|nr:MAG: nicotinate-nucleotide adenylyltransferase [Deltaproteobacteria bacterium]
MKTGILGGTFNPIHLAHLRIAEEVREACALDEVVFMPAAAPPHKPVAGAVSFAHRLAMIAAAIADNPAFRVSDFEARRAGKSFSVDTLELLRSADPHGERYFIVGLDSFRDIASWKDYTRLFELAHLVVTARPGVELADPLLALPVAARSDFCYDGQPKKLRHRSGNTVIFLEETRLDISSTLIRGKVAAGASIRYLVPRPVADYIVAHGLYRRSAA